MGGEVDGVSYHYVDKETIEEMIQNDEFIEHATFSNNTYGTSKAAVKTVVEQGKICILDIDTQGVIQIKKTDLNPLFVFIKPPSMEELEIVCVCVYCVRVHPCAIVERL